MSAACPIYSHEKNAFADCLTDCLAAVALPREGRKGWVSPSDNVGYPSVVTTSVLPFTPTH